MLAAEFLNEYAVEARYPGDFATISDKEAQKALNFAKTIKNYIIKLAEKKIFLLKLFLN